MNNDTIKLSEQDYRELYEGVFSKGLKTEGEAMAEYGKNEIDLLYRFIGFTYQMLSIVGIFAGFGFTAIDRVKNLYIFLTGEAMLVSSILVGLWWLKRFYESNLSAIQKSSNTVSELYKDRDKVYLEISKDYMNSQTLKKSNMLAISEKNNKILEFIGRKKEQKDEIPPHRVILILSVVGILLLLSSFLICPLK
ncbi:TPA: hypothetical protein DEQ89_03280 [Candidatus Daviesbacteria bacterium]|nr:MAG: hypothetical protein A3C29_06845 [Candidatus Daviesbacteria bacterium RIFCSPHIGHO2_02_FULL_40_16]OGE43593.1 MAG: hypothetical protein A3A53_03095 [Candidatus Daviesbacteria bacterium RIFCSPLOWO2_01_FULL_39_23]OGE67866.1 MAG: hypothetical protein A3J16_02985 [Candidatus Daviesbacteria bacterium RIFCSPLOWO2_02_FULL_39_13]HCE31014.1 hypothetical protein [Candidatus Daviesbacteria bacterium]